MTMVFENQAHRVYTKLNWSDEEWTLRDNLFANSCVFSCAPDISKAVLHWRYGRVMGYGESSFTNRERLDISDYYVKIEIDRPATAADPTPLEWYGIVVSDVREIDGPFDDDVTIVPAGTQEITVLGLEYLLTRKVIDTSIVEDGSGGEKTIKRAIAFNLGSGNDSSSIRWPNMGGKGSKAVNIFDDRLDGSTLWSSRDIIEYLLAYHVPKNDAEEIALEWTVDPDSNALHLEWDTPMLHVHGKTLWDVLNMVIDRRRLSGWKVTISDGHPSIYVFTFNRDDIVLPDDKEIVANPEQYRFQFDDDPRVKQPIIERDNTSEFVKVIARGERRGYCLTLNNSESTLEADWDAGLQTTYNSGASGIAGYAAMLEQEKQEANKAFRNRDNLKRVYRYFRVPPTATWIALVTSTGAGTDEYWWPGVRFESFIPLKTDITYGNTITAEDLSATTGDTLAKSKKEYRRPFAVIKTSAAGATAAYEFIDRMSQGDSTTAYNSGGRDWSCSLRMADDAPSIIMDVSGPPQHVIASNEFSAVDDADKADWPAELDWRTVYATVFMQGDQYAEQSWPDLPFPTTDDVAKVLIIDVPNMRLDYVVPTTVTGLESDGSLTRTTNGGYIHDDRAKLLEIARVAYEWYSQPRNALTVSDRSFDIFLVGDLITRIGDGTTEETVNSVVTQVAFDLRRGMVQYRTAFGELDFGRLL